VLAAAFPELGIGFLAVALAFGLTVLTGAYAFGHISGGHFNPAVSVGLWVGGRLEAKDLAPYIISQLIGGTIAALVLYIIVQGQTGFASNGYGDLSPNHFSLISAFLIEAVLTAFFLIVILGSTDHRAPAGFAPIAIGLTLTVIHLIN
jgi:aquaporin Z